ncbi:MAG: RTX toxin transporter, determinant D, partial [uncultured Gemmatimonadetes bacterium]
GGAAPEGAGAGCGAAGGRHPQGLGRGRGPARRHGRAARGPPARRRGGAGAVQGAAAGPPHAPYGAGGRHGAAAGREHAGRGGDPRAAPDGDRARPQPAAGGSLRGEPRCRLREGGAGGRGQGGDLPLHPLRHSARPRAARVRRRHRGREARPGVLRARGAGPGHHAGGGQDGPPDAGDGGHGGDQNEEAARDRVLPHAAAAAQEREPAGAI